MRSSEHQIAVAVMVWWAYSHKRIGVPDHRLLFAIPNGGLRNIRVAMNLKAEGVRAGIPDYFLAVPRQGKAGLFIELKAENGRLSPEQGEMLELFGDQGYGRSIAYGTDEAIKAIEGYLS